MTEHKVKQVSSGGEYESFLTAVCSCGWRGKAWSCYNDWQMHMVSKDEREHLQSVRSQGQPRK